MAKASSGVLIILPVNIEPGYESLIVYPLQTRVMKGSIAKVHEAYRFQ